MRVIVLFWIVLLASCGAASGNADCEALVRIDNIPMKATYSEVLNSIDIKDSPQLDSCLAEKILDDEKIEDPREAPPVASYSVGDTAFFLLVMKYDLDIQDFLEEPFRSRWRDEGVYAYFDYVSQEKNRSHLASLVKERIEE